MLASLTKRNSEIILKSKEKDLSNIQAKLQVNSLL